MATFSKVTMFYKIGENGWSESWYSTITDLLILKPPAQRLATFRMGLAGSDVVMNYMRLSVEGIFRDARVVTNRLQGNTDWGTSDPVRSALSIRLTATDLYRRIFLMRGIPDSQIILGRYVPTGPYENSYNNWRSVLKSGIWGIRAVDRATHPLAPITSANPLTGVITLPDPAAPLVNHRIRITGGINMGPFQGTWLTAPTVTTANSIKLLRFPLQPPLPDEFGPGFYRIVDPSFFPFTDADTQEVSSRKTGRPFGALRGIRRRAR